MSHSTNTFRIVPGKSVNGMAEVPGDKSISHRALMLGAIADGETEIHGFLPGEDCLATLTGMRKLGATISTDTNGVVRVRGVGAAGLRASPDALDLGNSGTAMRLLCGLLAGQKFRSVLTGDESLRSRPMERVAIPLREMGAKITTNNGRAPLTIEGGNLKGIKFASPVASAQLKSAVLLAGLYATGTTTVIEPGITRDHTEKMLAHFGAELKVESDRVIIKGPQQLKANRVEVPGDLSSAAFPLCLGLLGVNGNIRINSAGINPTRTGILDLLACMGADIEIRNQRMLGAEPVADLIAKPTELTGTTLPEKFVPLAIDELPMIFALAACASGRTTLRGAEELRHKESDRIAMMAQGLQALGIEVQEHADGITIHGGRPSGGRIESGGDHRIAMAFAVLASRASGPVVISDTANVNTSFPGFVELMQSLGLQITEQTE